MKNNELFKLFVEELEDMYSSENQIIEALPKLIKLATISDLKQALSKHLKETENQVKRIEKIFMLIDLKPKKIPCEAMKGLITEADSIVEKRGKSAALDAAIISACQKVEHYEIASYGTLRSFAKQLQLDNDVITLLQDTLEEEAQADKKLSKIAEGTIFTTGVNQEATEKTASQKK